MTETEEKARAWRQLEAEKQPKSASHSPIFSSWRAQNAKNRGVHVDKSHKFLKAPCKNRSRSALFGPLFLSLTPTKETERPTKRGDGPTKKSAGQSLLLHFFRPILKNRGPHIRSESDTYPKNTPKSRPYISDSHPPPEKSGLPGGPMRPLEVRQ